MRRTVVVRIGITNNRNTSPTGTTLPTHPGDLPQLVIHIRIYTPHPRKLLYHPKTRHTLSIPPLVTYI